MMTSDKLSRIKALSEQIRHVERPSARQLGVVSSGLPELDALLPDQGLPLGSLIEIMTPEGSGGYVLALQLARIQMTRHSTWAVVDPSGSRHGAAGETFYPPAAAGHGLDLRKLVLVRTPAPQAGWVCNQLLRCAEIGVTFVSQARFDHLTFRRLQLAAEAGGALGFVIHPPTTTHRPAWAALRLLVEPASGYELTTPAPAGRPPLQLTVLHVRGGRPGATLLVDPWRN